jgi:hypothetical protein|tara:strand:- start:324 stop:506 length:183 start_codon:yes stop_codon:yes gene_type:complete
MDNIKSRARKLLQKHALQHAIAVTGDHDYLPETDEEAVMFEPHSWAISAVVEALKTKIKE